MKKHYKKTKNLFLLVLILQLFTNCNYEFSEDYFKEIKQEAPIATLSLKDFTDNKTLYTPLNVSFNYDGKDRHRLYEIRIYIDNNLIKTSLINTGEFLIDIDNLEDGNHSLTVEYLFSAGTGSLADIYNVEGYISTNEFSFIIDKSSPETIVLKNVELIDGTIYLNWEPPSKLNFQKIFLNIKSNGTESGLYEWSNETLENGIFNDSHSVLNNLSYSVLLENRYGNSVSNEVTLNMEEISITKEIINENEYKLKISKHPLYSNFEYYSVFTFNADEFIINSVGGESVVKTEHKFPNHLVNDQYTKLTFINPKLTNEVLGTLVTHIKYGKDFEDKNYTEFVFNEIENSYFGLELINLSSSWIVGPVEVYLNKLDSNNLETLERRKISTIDDLDANIIIDPLSNDLILDAENISYRISSVDFSIINQWYKSDYTSEVGTISYRNDIITIQNDQEISFYSASTKTLIYKTAKDGYFKFSNDGRYFYTQNTIYEIANGNVSIITSTIDDGEINVIEFLSDQNKCIYSDKTKSPVIFDFNSKTKTIINDLTGVNIIQYDKKTQKILFGQLTNSYNVDSYVNIYDLSSGNFKKLRVVYSNSTYYFFKYLNGKLIYSGGQYLDQYLN